MRSTHRDPAVAQEPGRDGIDGHRVKGTWIRSQVLELDGPASGLHVACNAGNSVQPERTSNQ